MKKEDLLEKEKKSPINPNGLTGAININTTSSNDYTETKSEEPIQTNYNKEPGHEKAAPGTYAKPVGKIQPYQK